jgi:hypothetical protein
VPYEVEVADKESRDPIEAFDSPHLFKVESVLIVDAIRIAKRAFFDVLTDDGIRAEQVRPGYEASGANGELRDYVRFLRKLLTRPHTSTRVQLFTTNVDLLFEEAFSALGVQARDGFVGTHPAQIRLEAQDHDLFYPSSATSGKVRRVDRVLHFHKLHGSIDWLRQKPSATNPYGVLRRDISLIKAAMHQPEHFDGELNFHREPLDGEDDAWRVEDNLMIYPTPEKYGETLSFPYTTLLREFHRQITQPQTVLFTLGYSFNDDHINRLIYQALAQPSFHLVVVDPACCGSWYPVDDAVWQALRKKQRSKDGESFEPDDLSDATFEVAREPANPPQRNWETVAELAQASSAAVTLIGGHFGAFDGFSKYVLSDLVEDQYREEIVNRLKRFDFESEPRDRAPDRTDTHADAGAEEGQ